MVAMNLREFGEVMVTTLNDPSGPTVKVRIEQADPTCRITDELLDRAARGETEPWLTLSLGPDHQTFTVCDDFGKRYIYRIDRYDIETNSWEASWPD